MSAHEIFLEERGMVGDDSSAANQGAHDCSPIWNQVIPAGKEGDTIWLPPHYCAFKSPIAPLPSGTLLKGQGGVSHMVRCFSGGTFLTPGVFDSTIESVRLWAADGTTGGVAIGRHASSPADAPFGTTINDVEITRFTSGSFDEGIHLDGGMGAPEYGARRIRSNGVTISGVKNIALWLGGCVSCQFTQLIAGAGSPGISIFTVGYDPAQYAGYPKNPCNQIDIQGAIDGLVVMYRTLASKINAATLSNVVIDGNCAGSTVECANLNSGNPLVLGPNCFVYGNGRRWPA